MAKRGRPKLHKMHKAGYHGPVRRRGRPSHGPKSIDMLYNTDGTLKGKKKKTVRATIIFD